MALSLVARDDSDLLRVLARSGIRHRRAADPAQAVALADSGGGVLLLAGGYPNAVTRVDSALHAAALAKDLRLYVEYPAWAPGLQVAASRLATRERVVVASAFLEPALEPLHILTAHGCRYQSVVGPVDAFAVQLVLARVAGFDTAVYGLPEDAAPALLQHRQRGLLVATTCLSQFVTGRYAPADAWRTVWRWILVWLARDEALPVLEISPTVHPACSRAEPLPPDIEREAVRRGVDWYRNARLLIDASWEDEARERMVTYPDGTGPGPEPSWPVGDGSLGLLEGASSRIHADGSQDWRYHVRADCAGETSMAMAAAAALLGDPQVGAIAANLNDFIYRRSVLAQGPRADPASPSYGLLSWTTKPPADGVYYGDDNARAMLGTLAAAAFLGSQRWDQPVLRCLLANLRTTGTLGFRGRRLEEAELQLSGWRNYWEAELVHVAPHYEAWLWAVFLWSWAHTGFHPLLARATNAIRMTMAAYPGGWHWTNGLQQERARMLLPLAWLVRVDDTGEHRQWLRRIATDLLQRQEPCGAILEALGEPGLGAYRPPESNAAYGTAEAPLIQRDGDPLSDLLYTVGFAFVGLHEAAAATREPVYQQAEDRLADLLCRIQVRSVRHPELDGAWFRAFDHRRWAYWGSNADVGWGAWCVESGWSQAWVTSVLALRQLATSFWDLTSQTRIGQALDELLPVMLPGEA